MEEHYIDIGIATKGSPIIRPEGTTSVVENVLIGLGFHWEKCIECRFPGILLPAPEELAPVTLINRLPIETYLECVVGSEMNPQAPIEFLKAHAIVSRSWAVGKMMHIHSDGNNSSKIFRKNIIVDWEDSSDHNGFHLCNDDHCQRYQGIQPLSDVARQAIQATKGLVIVGRSGNIIDARFSKCCGGKTERFSSCWQNVEAECLESFEDPWCDLSLMDESARDALLNSVLKGYDRSTGGGYRWNKVVKGSEIKRLLNERYSIDIGDINNISPISRAESGRIILLGLGGTKGSVEIGKELTIRRILSADCLYSSAFDVEGRSVSASGDVSFMLSGKGWGHGVGMCQVGAANMGAHGHTAEEILQFYYPGSQIRPLFS